MTELNLDLLNVPPRLLIIDDVPANLKVLLAALAGEYDVLVANSGPLGLELASKHQPELIMLDISMPGMDGLQVCQKLKSDPQLKHIPVVFATALSDATHEAKGLLLGAADFINKPFRIEVVRLRIRNIIDRQRLAKLIDQQNQALALSARLDNLTKLPNRTLLEDRLQTAISQSARNKQLIAVVFIDLDGFKAVNDAHGHLAGDHLLKTLALRLQDCVRQGDTAARLGGDEFVVLATHLNTEADCLVLLERILESMSTPVKFDLAELQVSASLGVTFYRSDSEKAPVSSTQLIHQADQAMYKAKKAGKNQYAFFGASAPMVQARAWSYQDLELALGNGQLELVFSPVLDLATGSIQTVEALLRWNHPQAGVLGPSSFLATLQHHTLSVQIDRWVLHQAAAQQQAWQAQGLDLTLTVNLSTYHLSQPDFPKEVKALLEQHGACPADRLQFDIVEVADPDRFSIMMGNIQQCSAMGVKFSLDDFGSGQSSLTFIRHVPLHQVKMDAVLQEGVDTDAHKRAVLLKLIDLLRTMGFSVLAECTESEQAMRQAKALGFDALQGLALHAHLRAADVPGFVRDWKAPRLDD